MENGHGDHPSQSGDQPSNCPKYSFVLPVFNEVTILRDLRDRMTQVVESLDGPSEVIMVDDGSQDGSTPLIQEICERDQRFKSIHLARNFGHQVAISAGMDHATGQATIVMDADLQDPPEVVHKMIEKWKEGYEVVYAVREERQGETWFKKLTARAFYRLLGRMTDLDIPVDVGDFRLIDRKALDAFLSLRETNRYVRGMFSWVGFKQIGVHYERQARHSGETKYPIKKMLKLAIDGIVSFSNRPLNFALKLGFAISGIAFLIGVWAIYQHFAGETIRGWTSQAVISAFIGGTQLIVLGIMGEYVGRIYEEVKNRPLYLVSRKMGLGQSQRAAVQSSSVTLPNKEFLSDPSPTSSSDGPTNS